MSTKAQCRCCGDFLAPGEGSLYCCECAEAIAAMDEMRRWEVENVG